MTFKINCSDCKYLIKEHCQCPSNIVRPCDGKVCGNCYHYCNEECDKSGSEAYSEAPACSEYRPKEE